MKKITTLLSALLISAIGFQSQAQISTFPYIEDFESGAGGWTVAGTGTFALGTPANTIINSAASGTNAWVTNLTGNYNGGENVQVVSPIFDLSGTTNPEVHVKVWWNSELSWDGMVLQSSIDGGFTWQNVGAFGDPNFWYNDNTINGAPGSQQEGWTGTTFNNGSGGWVNATHTIANLNTQANVTFRMAFGSDNAVQDEGVAFDDFSIFDISCPQPTALGDSNVTISSADLFWSEDGIATEWEIELGIAGFSPTGIATNSGILDSNFAATGLMPNTPYEYYVRAICGPGDSSLWVGPHIFTTPCIALLAPFAENFSSTSSTQNCWTVLDNNNDGDTWDMDNTANPLVGDEAAAINTDFNNGANDDYLISPTITLVGNEQLTFSYRANSTFEPNDFQVLISTTGLGVASFIDTLMIDTVSSTTYLDTIIDLSAYTGDVNIAFHVPNGGLDGWILYIDDIRVAEPCTEATTGVASAVTTSSADLAWTTTGTAAGSWSIEYGPAGFVQGTGSIISGTTFNPHPVAGLLDGTDYDFYIISNCALGEQSAWAGPFNFTTDTCGMPTALVASNITATSADLGWAAGGSESLWDVELGTAGFTPTGTPTTAGTTNTSPASGLTPLSNYDFYVRAVCSGGLFSPWAGPLNFSTISTVGINENVAKNNVTISPNPNNGIFTLNVKANNASVEVMNTQGQVILTKNILNNKQQIDLSNNAKGIYFVTVTSENGVSTHKVSVQ